MQPKRQLTLNFWSTFSGPSKHAAKKESPKRGLSHWQAQVTATTPPIQTHARGKLVELFQPQNKTTRRHNMAESEQVIEDSRVSTPEASLKGKLGEHNRYILSHVAVLWGMDTPLDGHLPTAPDVCDVDHKTGGDDA